MSKDWTATKSSVVRNLLLIELKQDKAKIR